LKIHQQHYDPGASSSTIPFDAPSPGTSAAWTIDRCRREKREAFIQAYEADYAEKWAASEEQIRALAKQKGRRGKLPEPMPKDPPPPVIPDELQDLGEDKHVEPEVEVSTTEEEVRSAMMTGQYAVTANSMAEQLCFAIIVYCLDPEFESQWQSMLAEAFRHFPDKDYCLVMLPHDSKVPPMLTDFTRVSPIPSTKAPEQLYIFHRYGLLKDFEVWPPTLLHPVLAAFPAFLWSQCSLTVWSWRVLVSTAVGSDRW
jgi:hypothetical protein